MCMCVCVSGVFKIIKALKSHSEMRKPIIQTIFELITSCNYLANHVFTACFTSPPKR